MRTPAASLNVMSTGEENYFLFGFTAEQVAQSLGCYSPQWHYNNDPGTRVALDPIASHHFNENEPGVFNSILDTVLGNGDHYLHLADLKSYGEAHGRLGELYADQEGWSRKVTLSIAASGKFSSDRTIEEYARDIWAAGKIGVMES
jgi:glycogen phosphorylase